MWIRSSEAQSIVGDYCSARRDRKLLREIAPELNTSERVVEEEDGRRIGVGR
jgi:hypothetical protein